MKNRVLLSIHPEFADAILSGQKKVEFRRTAFKRAGVKKIVIYATSPIKRVIGCFEIDEIIADEPMLLWSKTQDISGITKEKFDNYFLGKKLGFAIKIKNPIKFLKTRPLSDYVSSNTPPQSFCYV